LIIIDSHTHCGVQDKHPPQSFEDYYQGSQRLPNYRCNRFSAGIVDFRSACLGFSYHYKSEHRVKQKSSPNTPLIQKDIQPF
jgi:hypothetical protein